MRPIGRTAIVVAAFCLAVGALGGVAAADDPGDGTTIDVDVGVDAAGEGGQGGFVCTGTPTDHDCDKAGELDAGPAGVDYEGFNGGSLEGGEYAFGDTFVVEADGQRQVVAFECELSDEPPEDNPCPVTTEEGDDDPGQGERRGEERNDAPGHANGPP